MDCFAAIGSTDSLVGRIEDERPDRLGAAIEFGSEMSCILLMTPGGGALACSPARLIPVTPEFLHVCQHEP